MSGLVLINLYFSTSFNHCSSLVKLFICSLSYFNRVKFLFSYQGLCFAFRNAGLFCNTRFNFLMIHSCFSSLWFLLLVLIKQKPAENHQQLRSPALLSAVFQLWLTVMVLFIYFSHWNVLITCLKSLLSPSMFGSFTTTVSDLKQVKAFHFIVVLELIT